MVSSLDIKETKELVNGLAVLAALVIKELKDGFQAKDDIGEILGNVAKSPELKEAFKDVHKVPAELKDLDFIEGFELAGEFLKMGPRVIIALRK